MRIALLVPTLQAGGAERVAAQLAEALGRVSQVTVITYDPMTQGDKPDWAHLCPKSCEYVHLTPRRTGAPVRLAALAWALRRHLVGHQYDILLSFLTYSNVMAFLATRSREAPTLVATEHSTAMALLHTSRKEWLQNRLLPFIYPRLTYLVTVSEAIRQEFLYLGLATKDRSQAVVNPIEPPSAATPSARQVGVEPAWREGSSRHVVCLGRLHPHKGQDVLISACALLPQGITVHLFGEGATRPYLEQQAQALGLESRLMLHNRVDAPYDIFRAADLTVIPSRVEGFGLTALESLAVGTPVVASDVGGLRELAGSLPIALVPAEDPSALAAAITRALDDPMPLPEVIPLQRFTPDAVASEYLSLFETLLQGVRP